MILVEEGAMGVFFMENSISIWNLIFRVFSLWIVCGWVGNTVISTCLFPDMKYLKDQGVWLLSTSYSTIKLHLRNKL